MLQGLRRRVRLGAERGAGRPGATANSAPSAANRRRANPLRPEYYGEGDIAVRPVPCG